MINTNLESLVFYRSYMEAAQEAGVSLQDRALFYEGIINYATLHQIPEFDNPILKGLFVVCKANIDANVLKYEQRMSAMENGKKGGAPKGNKNAAKRKGQEEKAQQKAKTNKKKAEKDNLDSENTYITESEENKTSQETLKSTEKKQEIPANDNKNTPPVEEKETTGNKLKTTPQTTLNDNLYDNVDDNENKNNNSNVSSFLEKRKKEKDIKEQRTLQQRNVDFYNSLLPYIKKYGLEPITEFYHYWGEPNWDRTKLRFEMEPTWHLEGRLESWMRQRARLENRKYGY